MAFKKENKVKTNFTKITIGLASPEEILANSYGEVLKPETINYRTYKPERDGLFCERIFGPTKDYECHCGKYKRIRYKGNVCDRCGVEITEKKVRRERSGHIQLVVPVAHIWYFRSLPNKIGYLLGIPTKKLDAVIYYERYIVLQPGVMAKNKDIPVQKLDLLSEDEYEAIMDRLPQGNEYLDDKDPNKFIAKMGAEAIYDLLCELDLDSLSNQLRDEANKENAQQHKNDVLKRLQVVESFRLSSKVNRPEWMIMRTLPVIALCQSSRLSFVPWCPWMAVALQRVTSTISIVVSSFVTTDSRDSSKSRLPKLSFATRSVCFRKPSIASSITAARAAQSRQKATVPSSL